MKIHRFVLKIKMADLDNGGCAISEPDFFHQVYRVLKLKPGEKIILSDGAGEEAMVEIVSFENDNVAVRLLDRQKNKNELPVRVILACAILKKDNFEWLVQKAVEVGVKEIVPLLTSRTIKTNLKMERLNKICREAAEQSGRGSLPEVREPVELESVLDRAGRDEKIICDPGGKEFFGSLKMKPGQTVWVFIGPEGGWTEKELEDGAAAGAKIMNLGAGILRGETAGIIAGYLAGHNL